MWTPPQEHGGDVTASWQAPGPGMQQWRPPGLAQPDAVALQQEVADLRQQVRSPCHSPAAKACLLLGCSAGARCSLMLEPQPGGLVALPFCMSAAPGCGGGRWHQVTAPLTRTAVATAAGVADAAGVSAC